RDGGGSEGAKHGAGRIRCGHKVLREGEEVCAGRARSASALVPPDGVGCWVARGRPARLSRSPGLREITATPPPTTPLARMDRRRIDIPPPPIPGFRPVPFTGVIYVMAEAMRRGYSYGSPDWCNLGQGQPETGPLPG